MQPLPTPLRFLEYPNNVHMLIARHLRRRSHSPLATCYSVIHWLSALQLHNPVVSGWLDPEVSEPTEECLLELIEAAEPLWYTQLRPRPLRKYPELVQMLLVAYIRYAPGVPGSTVEQDATYRRVTKALSASAMYDGLLHVSPEMGQPLLQLIAKLAEPEAMALVERLTAEIGAEEDSQ